jgi:uncharacterized protein (TIGR03000 family)
MATLAGGGAAPEWGHRGQGGYGYAGTGCFGCAGPGYGNGGYSGYGHTGNYGGFSTAYVGYTQYPAYVNQANNGAFACYGCGGYGCYGFNGYGNTGTYGCYGQAFYGHGHVYGGHGCYGEGFTHYGCYGNWTCYGMIQGSPYHPTPTVVPGKGTEPEKVPPPKKDDKNGKEEVSDRGRLVVELPEDAKLFIDGQPTRTPSARREFQTPPLQPGETYYYELRAEVVRNGQTKTETQRVLIRPGHVSQANFTSMDPTAVASAGK